MWQTVLEVFHTHLVCSTDNRLHSKSLFMQTMFVSLAFYLLDLLEINASKEVYPLFILSSFKQRNISFFQMVHFMYLVQSFKNKFCQLFSKALLFIICVFQTFLGPRVPGHLNQYWNRGKHGPPGMGWNLLRNYWIIL